MHFGLLIKLRGHHFHGLTREVAQMIARVALSSTCVALSSVILIIPH